ncbi:DUF742 domain-containing protein [Pseudonocardia phyllosphaerae]|uniref:DUF742 domain-containing protein n=1 Tax=Pseudonocardia phyllosphaerae TaxID=3390502 RepID=UPI00397AF4C5
MNQDPDDGHGPEPTFADVMNGFSLDSARKPKKRRWGRNRGASDEENAPQQAPEQQAPAQAPAEWNGPAAGSAAYGLPPTPDELDSAGSDQTSRAPQMPQPSPAAAPSGASSVRPYAWTRGRTKSGYELAVETLVSVGGRAAGQLDRLPMEHRAVADLLLEQTRSVAEVAALLSLPLGVARVLLGDMAAGGTVTVHQTASTPGDVPDLALMERVLSGLRRL